MKKTFDKNFLMANRGCYSEEKMAAQSFYRDDCTLDMYLDSDIPLRDKFWFVLHKCELTERHKKDLAIICAETVLPIYEKKYPDNKTVRDTIQAAKDYLDGVIGIDELKKKQYVLYNVSYAAHAIAYDAAAFAAFAAYVNPSSIGYAVDAVDAVDEDKFILLQVLKDFCKNLQS